MIYNNDKYCDLRALRLSMVLEAQERKDERIVKELFALTEDQFELWYRNKNREI